MIIKTKRLILREMNMDDFEALSKVLGDERIMQYYPHSFNEEMIKN